ncbi:GtrA family protein [Sphingopyxis sp.]|uniref:GtrA family protein n=1 Tax=Sphingopyxis sp. TaxID=1908224 RepID=UPI0026128DC1|nr:GtrA family protein [Sphingopyxis sp.]MCW0199754.1 GtrA family protein [Sphingopyxis sp.]
MTARSIAAMRRSRFLRFLAVGVVNTLVGYLLFAALIALGAPPLSGVMASTALGALFNFGSIGHLVFRNTDVALLPRFLGVYAGQCAVNSGLLMMLGVLGLGSLLAQLLLIPWLAVGTYLAMRHFVYRNVPDAASAGE